jgi:glycosyltransferase involved in cell wall biosynthesis
MTQNITGINATYELALIGNYLPRRCGIATFTTDLAEALSLEAHAPGDEVIAVAMTDIPEGYAYPGRVKYSVSENVQTDYLRASEFLNTTHHDAVILQHEYGIFGGEAGAHILHLVKNLRSPLITTLHSVLLRPSDSQKRVLLELAACSQYLVVMSQRAELILQDVYGVPPEKVRFIPHGIPDLPLQPPDKMKRKLGFEGHKVVLTFGLLGPNKGVEEVIQEMPKIVSEHPDAIYVVLGATHPNILREQGEDYRFKLQHTAKEMGVGDHVWFYNQFVDLQDLVEYLLASDIYVTPYTQEEQITSGTLAYSIGAGNAVVSTPYWYAEELLVDGRGCIVPFGRSDELGKAVRRLFSNDAEREAMRTAAYQFSRRMIWKEVARDYLGLVDELIAKRDGRRKGIVEIIQKRAPGQKLLDEVPKINLEHLQVLTDDTGILQHATYDIPNRSEGYCTDDNARALIVACDYYRLRKDESVTPLLKIYLAFVLDAFDSSTGFFRNFMSYDRRWLEENGSEDSHGRALWSLGFTVRFAPNELLRSMALELMERALPATETMTSPRAWAFSILGAYYCLRDNPDHESARRVLEALSGELLRRFEANTSDDWIWLEDTVNYSNAKLAHALMVAGALLENQPMYEKGIAALAWLLRLQTASDGHLSLIGNDGWLERGGKKAQYDQQPVDAMGLVWACTAAYWLSGQEEWRREAERCFSWFMGVNDIGEVVCDLKTGGCFDGLSAHGVSRNQGAESTLSYLLSVLAMYEIAGRDLVLKNGNV